MQSCWPNEEPTCPMCNQMNQDQDTYTYRCSACGRCYACSHQPTPDGEGWVCWNGTVRRGWDDGLPVNRGSHA